MEPATAILFTSMTCPHCPQAKKVFEQVSEDRDDTEFHNMMMHEPQAQQLAKQFGVQSVPTFIIYGPSHENPMGLVGTQSDETLNKYINIAIGKQDLQEKQEEAREKKPFLKRLFS
ncbi:MAG: thioredoxin domain-containing protein [Nanobdellota archaeon]